MCRDILGSKIKRLMSSKGCWILPFSLVQPLQGLIREVYKMSVTACRRVQAVPIIIEIIEKREVHSKCEKEKETPQEIKSEFWDILLLMQTSRE